MNLNQKKMCNRSKTKHKNEENGNKECVGQIESKQQDGMFKPNYIHNAISNS